MCVLKSEDLDVKISKEVQCFVAKGALDACDRDVWFPLHEAVRHGLFNSQYTS